MTSDIKFDWEMPAGNWTRKNKHHEKFAEVLIKLFNSIQEEVGKLSARGWCYQLEQFGVITKNQFDKIQDKINECVKRGLLPMDFVAEDVGHKWLGVEVPSVEQTQEEYLKDYFKEEIRNAFWYVPDWWVNEKYYIQLVVEKIDLVTLFKPVCDTFHIPITNAKGTGAILQRGLMAERFKEAEERGLQPVLLYCGDHDPDGLRIGESYRKLLDELKGCWLIGGFKGYNPENLIIERFGLNADWIDENNLTWLNNLKTGRKKKPNDLSDINHPNHNLLYVQNYIGEFGVRKCEANALVVVPKKARQLCRDAIESYLDVNAEQRFEKIKNENLDSIKKICKRVFLEVLDNEKI